MYVRWVHDVCLQDTENRLVYIMYVWVGDMCLQDTEN